MFEENETARTQEFRESSVKEIVRQQWNFSPPNSIREVEEYQVELSSVTVLELAINPNISGGLGQLLLQAKRIFQKILDPYSHHTVRSESAGSIR